MRLADLSMPLKRLPVICPSRAWSKPPVQLVVLIGDMGMVACKVKDVPMVSNDFTKYAEATIEKGHLVPDTHYVSIDDSKAVSYTHLTLPTIA